ncbi:xylulokinase [Allomuricauda sp. CP2A]|jgi:xylulokinase|uniref:xylulokinase n=1 Tax=Allomuricauda sp. CP2A TaxID=1848189 RepID=UPI00082EC75E|nr:FGGY family carbohydrate kinase [Muricauda sp. CP2A]
MYYLGIDLGSSSIKLALVERETGKKVIVVQEPEGEMPMMAPRKGWAEQRPQLWWELFCTGTKKIIEKQGVSPSEIVGLGIAYQMHGLVLIDKNGETLGNSIIWCDSRAVAIGDEAYETVGRDTCESRLLNSPGNFTASKLGWVKRNQPKVFGQIYKFLLPGDYIAFRLSGIASTTIPGLSEGIFWDFHNNCVSREIMDFYGIPHDTVPEIVETFGVQGKVSAKGAEESGLVEGIPILYRAGDQPNNALSLNVFEPGELAASGGTSGVVYAVVDNLSAKECSRINNFAHVNYKKDHRIRIGKLLCINGAGIQYRWLLDNLKVSSYEEMNSLASEVEVGSDGLCTLPFGNGCERMLNNRDLGTRILNLDLNRHTKGHLCRSVLEGIAFSFVYGMEIMGSDGVQPKVLRAGNDNLFKAEIFADTIATLIQGKIEIYNTTGAVGAARACAIHETGYGDFTSIMENDLVMTHEYQTDQGAYLKAFEKWKKELELIIKAKK